MTLFDLRTGTPERGGGVRPRQVEEFIAGKGVVAGDVTAVD